MVWPENEKLLRAFLLCHTQWRRQLVIGLASAAVMWSGLDYAGVQAALRMARVKLSADEFTTFQAMEMAALEELNRA